MIISNINFNPLLYRQKSVKGNDKSTPSQILKILPPKDILTEKSFESIIQDIKDQLNIPEKNFYNIYLYTINGYAEFIQSLPSTNHANFTFNKGQLLLSLIRASIALEQTDNYPCPIFKDKISLSQVEQRAAIWQYAVFSASLLLDIGSAISSLSVETCQENGSNMQPWLALDGAMTINKYKNTHYRYRIIDAKPNGYNNKLNLIFARMIIPDFIFTWIYNEQDIFIEWLSLLEDQAEGSGTMHKLIQISIRTLLNEYMGSVLPQDVLRLIPTHIKKKGTYHKASFWKGVEFSLRGEKSTPRAAEQNYGTEFLAWLKEGIANKSISVNQKNSKVHISNEGVFLINPEIFIDFCNKYPKHANWQTVFKQFNRLGITKYTSETSIYQYTFPNIDAPKTKQGLIIDNPKNIFGDKRVPSISAELSTEAVTPIKNSTIFPTPREEVGSYMRHMLKPRPEIT